jgi:argininosuccinate lyase
MGKLWGGRFETKPDDLMDALGESVSFDSRLAPWDIRASIAHARMLGAQKIIPPEDAKNIVEALQSIAADVDAGAFPWDPALEDVHTNIEAALVDRIGDAGKRLHTGRSRNDQVATDVRLWARDQADAVIALLRDVQAAFIEVAERNVDAIMPGFTHMQHAQPVLFAHHMLAYFEMFARDRCRFQELRPRINVLPLGSAALAGTTYPIDRQAVANELGFESLSQNSMDAVADRDYLIEFCAAAAIAMMHLSRLCEELVLWTSQEFQFIEIGEAFTTGSSIMPQKKNPDAAELIRGKTGRVYGSLLALLTTMKGLPLTYNRDMQEDKIAAFDASDTLQLSLAVAARLVLSISIDKQRMADATNQGFMEATELADDLAEKGVPFRQAHEIVGKIVLHCAKTNCRLTQLSLDRLRQFSPLFTEQTRAALQPQNICRRRNLIGGTAPDRVKTAIEQAKRQI